MGFDALSKSFLTTLPDHIGVYVTVFFILFMLIAAALAFPKNFLRNALTTCIAVASAWLSFVFCDFIYDTLMQYESVKAGIGGILESFPELASSQAGVLAVSKYVVSLVAVPILFLLLSGILNLGFKIAFLCKRNTGFNRNLKKIKKVYTIGQMVVKLIGITALPSILASLFRAYTENVAQSGLLHSVFQIYSDWKTIPFTLIRVAWSISIILDILQYLSLRRKPTAAERPKKKITRDVKAYVGALFGACTGAVVFMMIFFPCFSLANSAAAAVDVIPQEAVQCYEAVREEGNADDNIVNRVFSYMLEVKKYADSYSSTFVSGLYRKSGIYKLHCGIAPVGELETVLKSTVILGSYYYCDEHEVTIPEAEVLMTDAIYEVVQVSEFHDLLQVLYSETVPRIVSTGEKREEVRDSVAGAAKLTMLASLSEEEKRSESAKLAVFYQALCKVLVIRNNSPEEGIPPECLVPLGEMLDLARGLYSFSDTIDPLLQAIEDDAKIGKVFHAEIAKQGVTEGDFTYAEYMLHVQKILVEYN